jgi:hypothetical protein
VSLFLSHSNSLSFTHTLFALHVFHYFPPPTPRSPQFAYKRLSNRNLLCIGRGRETTIINSNAVLTKLKKNIILKYTTKLITFWTRRLQGDLHPCANTPLTLSGSNNRPFLCRILYFFSSRVLNRPPFSLRFDLFALINNITWRVKLTKFLISNFLHSFLLQYWTPSVYFVCSKQETKLHSYRKKRKSMDLDMLIFGLLERHNKFHFQGAGIPQWYSDGLRADWSGVRDSVGTEKISPHQRN